VFISYQKYSTTNLGEQDFDGTLLLLRQRNQRAWTALVGQLRRVTLQWITKRLGKMPSYALLSEKEFALEIFADSLSKFLELFEKGNFTKPEELQSLMFKVAELKTKEAKRHLRKKALTYQIFSDEDFEKALNKTPDWTPEDDLAKEHAKTLLRYLNALKAEERMLLTRFYSGEKMSQIAKEMGTTEET